MEPIPGGRGKKLIRALETAELHGRPTCSECTDALKARRGCNKPGESYGQGGPWRWTSPMLQGGDAIMYECPVGFLLRETPHLYDVLDASSYCESMSPVEYASLPRYMQHAFRVVQSERARLFDLKREREKTSADAAYGARVRAGR